MSLLSFLKNLDYKRIAYHVAFWIAITLFFDTVFSVINGDHLVKLLKYEAFILPSEIFAVYVTLYFLLPRLVLKRRFFPFLIVFSLVIAFSVFVLAIPMEFYAVKYVFHEKGSENWVLNEFLIYRSSIHIIVKTMIVGIAVGIKLTKTRLENQQIRQDLFREKLEIELKLKETELKYLRSQINPHFLFNSLNNLYGLTLEKSDKAPQVVLKISSLLDYMLYDCRDTYIELKKDIENILTYIELQKLRFGEDVKIDINISGDMEGLRIAPLLLLPLVENSFKHGLGDNIGEGWIKVKLKVEGNMLILQVDNSIPLAKSSSEKSGIGLQNVRKRLELQYKDRYDMEIDNKGDSYHVTLKVSLNS